MQASLTLAVALLKELSLQPAHPVLVQMVGQRPMTQVCTLDCCLQAPQP